MNPATDTILDIIRSRRSHRGLSSKPVPEEYVDLLLEAARWAPSSCNMQLLGLIRVDDPTLRERMVHEGRSHGTVLRAPVVFVVTYDRALSQEYNSNIQGGAAAIQNMMLVATSLGLGCFWAATVGKEKVIRSLLHIPERRAILALAMFGWPRESLLAPRRREPTELVHHNFYDTDRDVPLSGNPDDWKIETLKTFQELRLRSGARYRPYLHEEFQSVVDSILMSAPESPGTWLDVLPSTGAYTEALVTHFSETSFTIADIAPQVMAFVEGHIEKPIEKVLYDFDTLGTKRYDVVSCLFRLEAYPSSLRAKILHDAMAVVAPGGTLIVGVANVHSFFLPLYYFKRWLKREFRFPTMTPNVIGPFMPIEPEFVKHTIVSKGFTLQKSGYVSLLPTAQELSTFYTRNSSWKKPFIVALEKLLMVVPQRIRDRHSKICLFYFEKG